MPLAHGTLAQRPAQGSVAGDPYIAVDTKQSFIWSGTEWVTTENFTQAEHDALPNPHHDGTVQVSSVVEGGERQISSVTYNETSKKLRIVLKAQ